MSQINRFLNFSIRFKDSMGLMGGNIRLNIFQTLSSKMVLICLLSFAIQPLVGNKFSMTTCPALGQVVTNLGQVVTTEIAMGYVVK